jgi:hypothetical protein
VTPNGGSYPVWSRGGRELFYLSADQKIMSVQVMAGASGLTFSVPQLILEARVAGWEPTSQGSPHAVTADASRLLVSTAGDGVMPVTIVRNWTATLRQPTDR